MGTYGFTSYRNNSQLMRTCVARVADGSTECVDGSFQLGRAMGAGDPVWSTDESIQVQHWEYPELPPKPGPWQAFTYKNDDGQVRVCRGDVTSGDAWCVNSASRRATTVGSAPAAWEAIEADRTWFHYDSPFPQSGDYLFFAYHNDGGATRLCVGDAHGGDAFCRDGTAFVGQSSSGMPEFTETTDARLRWFRYFHDQPPMGEVGFGSYVSADRKTRVCRFERNNGNTWCVDGTTSSASTAGAGRPSFMTNQVGIHHFMYEAPPP